MAWPLRFARRVRAVEGRSCTGARVVLQHYAHNEGCFTELIEFLEHMPGRIFEADVINALAHIKLSRRSSPERAAVH